MTTDNRSGLEVKIMITKPLDLTETDFKKMYQDVVALCRLPALPVSQTVQERFPYTTAIWRDIRVEPSLALETCRYYVCDEGMYDDAGEEQKVPLASREYTHQEVLALNPKKL